MTYEAICIMTVVASFVSLFVLLRTQKSEYRLVYFSIAMIPFLVENSFIPYGDTISKILVFTGMIEVLYKTRHFFIEPKSLFFLGVALIVSLLSSGLNHTELISLLNLAYQVLLCQLVYHVVSKEKSMNILFKVFMLSATIISVGAIIDYALIGGRVSSVFYNPNFMAVYVAIGAVSFLVQRHILRFVCFSLICLAIYFSGSQSVLGALMLVMVLNTINSKLQSNKIITVTFVALVIVGVVITFHSIGLQLQLGFITNWWDRLISGKDDLRIYIWRAAIELFYANPVLGVGYGNFLTTMVDYVGHSGIASYGGMYSHNDYLRILAELGLPGFFAFVAMLISQVRIMLRQKPSHSQNIVVYSWVTILVFLLTHNYMTSNLFWIIFVLPSALRASRRLRIDL